MNFQQVSVGQKLPVGGYVDAEGTPSAQLENALEHTDASIGRMLHEAALAITREELAEPDGTVLPLRRGDHPSAGEWLLTRTYRISVERTPLMVITEWFLTTLGPFLANPS